MVKQQPLQAGASALVTVKLKPGSFVEAISSLVNADKVGWSGNDHHALGTKLLNQLTDPDGNVIILDQTQVAPIQLSLRPTEELQRTVLNETLARLGYQLDEDTEATFALLFNMPQFSKWLSDKKLIKADTSKGKKKSKFDSLLTGMQQTETTVSEPAAAVVEQKEDAS